MAAEFKIVLTDQTAGAPGTPGSNAPAPGGTAPPPYSKTPWALDPVDDRPLNKILEAKPAGWMGQLKGGMQDLFAGKDSSFIKQMGLIGQGGIAGDIGGLASASQFGPAGIAFKAAEIGASHMAEQFDRFSKGVKFAGEMMVDFAGNNHMGMFNRAIDFGANALGEIPVVGKMFSAELKAMAAPIQAFSAVVNAFVERGAQLAKYSGNIAGARARANVREIQADLREAQALGGSIGSMTDESSRIWVEIRDILLPIKEFIGDELADFLRGVRVIIEAVGPPVKAQIEMLVGMSRILIDLLSGNLSKAREDWKKMQERIANATQRRPGDLDLSNGFSNNVFGFGDAGGPVDPQRTAAQQTMNAPGFAF